WEDIFKVLVLNALNDKPKLVVSLFGELRVKVDIDGLFALTSLTIHSISTSLQVSIEFKISK
ncbi:hypothetical protein RUND412_003911, partial [Rhizina undulata]